MNEEMILAFKLITISAVAVFLTNVQLWIWIYILYRKIKKLEKEINAKIGTSA